MEAYKKDLAEWRKNYPKQSQQLNDEKKRKRQFKAEKKKKKLKRQKKDPNTPKRAMSAFMFYSQGHRPIIQEKNPDVSFGEIGRILGAEWKGLSEADREKYVKKAEEDRERYHKEMENYKNSRKQPEPSSSESESESESESCS
jgi:structure-specific recognition protein 1